MSTARGGVDAAQLAARVSQALRASRTSSSPLRLRPLVGGTSGLTFRGCDQDDDLVVKVAPAGLAPVGNRDVLRQAELLGLLARSGVVPVPRVLATAEGQGMAEPPFFVMEFVSGATWEPLHSPAEVLPPAETIAARLRHAVRLLAAMHDVPAPDWPTAGPNTLVEELDRWSTVYQSANVHATLFGRCADQLRRTLPAPVPPTLVHGDWRLGNMLCRTDRVVAIIDWEIWSVGDPRLDLGWFDIMTDPAHPRAVRASFFGLSPGSLHDEYATGRSLPTDLPWFDAFAAFKQSAIAALQAKHHGRGNTAAADDLSELVKSLLVWTLQ